MPQSLHEFTWLMW